jgi:hypothetical protein
VVVSYVKVGTLEFCCVVFVENVRWNVGVVTANKQGLFVVAGGEWLLDSLIVVF